MLSAAKQLFSSMEAAEPKGQLQISRARTKGWRTQDDNPRSSLAGDGAGGFVCPLLLLVHSYQQGAGKDQDTAH